MKPITKEKNLRSIIRELLTEADMKEKYLNFQQS